MFNPSLHIQRHQFVVDFVMKDKPKKVADLGCSDCGLLRMLKFRREIDLLVGVDVNGAKLTKKKHGLAPLSTDYLQPSFNQLCVQLYQGSVTQKDVRLRGFDLVTCIEVIEHLPLDDLDPFSEVVFGYMAPQTVIISTPNSEFNPLFPRMSGFRNSDHKFEWTRAEFQSWALKTCGEYSFKVEFTGVGKAPPGREESVGFCSQIAVFHRLAGRDGHTSGDDASNRFPYTLLYSINYPSLHDNNIRQAALVSEVLYWAEKLKKEWLDKLAEKQEEESCAEDSVRAGREHEGIFWTSGDEQECRTLHRHVSVPLHQLWTRCPKLGELTANLSNLSQIIMENPQIKTNQEGSTVILCNPEEEHEDEELCSLMDSGYVDAKYTDELWETDA
ncbi:small RNA 2'-O-methyltransferase isoform X2 [Nerophis ophidion]|uniref:small RNA 2'-O-methyltransferase isoform X2 n=1 Tax=Nerophis ophidion TaxID=159077 RepID=UPI002ADFC992|nr:small RNA 2'-O-methyltransferase isoform X2 [Nerophis ophidion]XP_061739869.1 small RNA 2'-O-methyltransferase isoform X2 [Nerophis ophidion]XP_061739870.1 small RNA 2'-O-methyltransferase isoform X2 [Nerophis ophidion]XP_061739871.1 small RNA 2'-O-methyltransferase isoform X2 [Nerophis ophidion]